MPLIRDIEEVKEFIKNSSPKSAVYVGCDSRQVKNHTVFVSVVVVHIDSCRGAKIFWRVDRVPRIRSLRQRLLEEVSRAVYLALEISEVVGQIGEDSDKYHIPKECHYTYEEAMTRDLRKEMERFKE